MEGKTFKSIISTCAKNCGFSFLHGAWFQESDECILVLCLQRSNFGIYYYLNIKIYVQGSMGRSFIKSKDLVKNIGNIFTRQPKQYDDVFNLENEIDDSTRKIKIEQFFNEYVVPFSEKALTRAGIKELFDSRQIGLLPAIQEDLGL